MSSSHTPQAYLYPSTPPQPFPISVPATFSHPLISAHIVPSSCKSPLPSSLFPLKALSIFQPPSSNIAFLGSPSSCPGLENPLFSLLPESILAALVWWQFSTVLFYSSSLCPSDPKDYRAVNTPFSWYYALLSPHFL